MIHKKCGDTEHEMVYQLMDIIDELLALGIMHYQANIEKVHSMPGQGVASTFKFGKNFGTWLGILAALEIPYMQVTPRAWMSHYGSMPKDKKDRKNYIKAMAQALYPKSGRITLATSDAILIAHKVKELAVKYED